MKKILLAVNNPLHQVVCLQTLRSLGYEATLARDGVETLAAAQSESFSLVFIDRHMPLMDGLAAAAIRELPGYAGVPLIALVADSATLDRPPSLEAGMNDYVAKPFSRAQMRQILAKYLTVEIPLQGPCLGGDESRSSSLTAPIDWQAARTQLPGGVADFRKYVELFREECHAHVKSLRQAHARANVGELRRAAHTLKSAADLFSARPLCQYARCLEEAVTQGYLDDASEDFAASLNALEQEWERLDRDLAQYLAGGNESIANRELTQPSQESCHADRTHC